MTRNRIEKLSAELERVWFFAEHLRPQNRERLVVMERFDVPSLGAISYWGEVADRLSRRTVPGGKEPESLHV